MRKADYGDCSELPSPGLPSGDRGFRKEIIGSSPSLKWVLQQVAMVAQIRKSVAPSGRQVHARAGIALIISRSCSSEWFIPLNAQI